MAWCDHGLSILSTNMSSSPTRTQEGSPILSGASLHHYPCSSHRCQPSFCRTSTVTTKETPHRPLSLLLPFRGIPQLLPSRGARLCPRPSPGHCDMCNVLQTAPRCHSTARATPKNPTLSAEPHSGAAALAPVPEISASGMCPRPVTNRLRSGLPQAKAPDSAPPPTTQGANCGTGDLSRSSQTSPTTNRISGTNSKTFKRWAYKQTLQAGAQATATT